MTTTHRYQRRGVSTLWLILTLPVFLTLLIFTVDIANLWLARVELENGLEAAALAAVREWGEAGGGSTEMPREVGVAYAQANAIRGWPIVIGTNYHPTNPNGNEACCHTAGTAPTGNLVFGSIREIAGKLTFQAAEEPACGIGTVLFDVTGNDLGDASAWGVSFVRTDETPENITIQSITFDLSDDPDGRFIGDAHVSGREPGESAPPIMDCQADTEGLAIGQIHFERLNQDASGYRTLKVTFETGIFEPGDRFRFGVVTSNVGGPQGNLKDDGDGVGTAPVHVAVIFAVGGVVQQPVLTSVVNTDNRGWLECVDTGELKDLPSPPTSGNNNDGQSYVVLRGRGQNDFAVRAQATVAVDSLARRLLGNCIGPYSVTAKATARYNCSEDRAWLVRVDDFVCSGTTP